MSSTITKFFASFLAYGVANKKKRFSAIGRFSEGLAPVKGKIQWGYINKEYDIVIPLMYERAFSFKEGLGMVVLNSQYGFIDHTGQIRIPFKYAAAHSFEQECARVCHDGLWGLIDRQGNYILPPTYSQMEQFAEGLALVSLHNKVGFINKKALNPQLHSRSATYKRNGLLIRKTAIKSSRPFQCAYYPLTP